MAAAVPGRGGRDGGLPLPLPPGLHAGSGALDQGALGDGHAHRDLALLPVAAGSRTSASSWPWPAGPPWTPAATPSTWPATWPAPSPRWSRPVPRLRSPGVDRAMQADLRFADGPTGRVTCSMWSVGALARRLPRHRRRRGDSGSSTRRPQHLPPPRRPGPKRAHGRAPQPAPHLRLPARGVLPRRRTGRAAHHRHRRRHRQHGRHRRRLPGTPGWSPGNPPPEAPTGFRRSLPPSPAARVAPSSAARSRSLGAVAPTTVTGGSTGRHLQPGGDRSHAGHRAVDVGVALDDQGVGSPAVRSRQRW